MRVVDFVLYYVAYLIFFVIEIANFAFGNYNLIFDA